LNYKQKSKPSIAVTSCAWTGNWITSFKNSRPLSAELFQSSRRVIFSSSVCNFGTSASGGLSWHLITEAKWLPLLVLPSEPTTAFGSLIARKLGHYPPIYYMGANGRILSIRFIYSVLWFFPWAIMQAIGGLCGLGIVPLFITTLPFISHDVEQKLNILNFRYY
jgi:hypothetical protein